MPPRSRRNTPEPLIGTGDLSASGLPPGQGGAGQILRDERPSGFWAIITAQPDAALPAYGFVRADDSDPTALAELEGAEHGDGDSLAAYEVAGSLTVPTDGTAVVWLEPLRGDTPGYGFEYAAGGGDVYGQANGAVPVDITPDNTWVSAGCDVTLPSAGTYEITACVAVTALITAGVGYGVLGRLYDSTAGAVIAPLPLDATGGQFSLLTMTVLNVAHENQVSYAVRLTVEGATVISLQARRTTGATWSSCYFSVGNLQRPWLAYRRMLDAGGGGPPGPAGADGATGATGPAGADAEPDGAEFIIGMQIFGP